MIAEAPRLGDAGRAVWSALHAPTTDGRTLTFRADELPMVVEFCRLVDDAERIRAELADRSLLATGSQGQPVVDPLRVELHRTTQRMESIAKTLALPDEEPRAAEWAGRSLARVRWG